MGPFSLTGQPSAMGGREAGAMANLLPGYRGLADAADRAELARAVEFRRCRNSPAQPPSRCSTPCATGTHQGNLDRLHQPSAIRCLNSSRVREALQTAEFAVVQDALGRLPKPPLMPTCCCTSAPGAKRMAR